MDARDDASTSPGLARLLFGLRRPVGRGTYAAVGFCLMLLKYAVDAGAVWLAAGVFWTPLDYLNPSLGHRATRLFGSEASGALQVGLFLWTLPFLWIGLAMTMRRLADAGLTPVLGFFYFLPGLNYALLLTLCLVPSRRWEPGAGPTPASAGAVHGPLRSALFGAATGIGVALPLLALVMLSPRPYGMALFVGTPVLMGAVGAWIHNRGERRPLVESLAVALFTMMVAFGGLLLFAIEGALCIAMTMPLGLVAALIGAVFGRELAEMTRVPALPTLGVLAAALAGGLLEGELREAAAFEVTTSIEIDAPPEVVWEHVVSFSELPPPAWAAFRLGIAYPVRARIEGAGVGAVRRCEFSTGAFVEPIVVWDAPRELAFDVAENPPPMHEWSPYRDLHPPHLDGAFESTWGRFLLTDLGDGRTRLEGTTRYRLDMEPVPYWRVWTDAIVHRIHRRVLAHVRNLAQSTAARD